MELSEVFYTKFSGAYNEFKLEANGQAPFINKWREEGYQRLLLDGIPHKQLEDWKYSDLNKVLDPAFIQLLKKPTYTFRLEDIFRCDVPDLDTQSFTTLDGWYSDTENPLQVLPDGVIIGSFREAALKYPEIVEKYLGQATKTAEDGLSGMNAAFATDGMFIYIPENCVVEVPLQIIDIISAETDLLVNRRNLFVGGKNSVANVVVCDHSLTFQKSFTNSFTEVFTENGAVFNMTMIQNSSNNTSRNSSVFVSQKGRSTATINTISLHGGFIRNNIHVALEGEFAESNLHGLYLGDRNQHVDNFTIVNHKVPDCLSNQKYKGILDDQARGVFTGRVVVSRDAQRTNAFQANNNILLKDTAHVDSKPQLEIYADDVRCSHGATVGQLDTEALFYLRSRGINEKEARMMLMFSFAAEVVDKITVPALKLRITDMVEKRLRGELSRCNHCAINCC
ncbi:MAG: Fe-S cluster assembly protein SufD [Bacteroidetes bacterium]|nr:Fe-S cluster assembly protein SufD [Bacteroidota bacterium]MBU1718463.1 Fe-S cluster assembly protein SufD [Bacteroidota bacterium]